MAIAVRDSGTGRGVGDYWKNAVTVNVPGDLEDGDYLVCILGTSIATSAAAPSGWTRADTQGSTTGNDRSIAIYYKYVSDAGSEPSSYLFVVGYMTYSSWWIGSLSGVDSTTPQDETMSGNAVELIDDTSPAAPSITTASPGAFVLAGWATNSDSYVYMPGGSWTTEANNVYITYMGLNVASQTFASAGATGAVEITGVTAGQETSAGQWAFRPAGVTPEASTTESITVSENTAIDIYTPGAETRSIDVSESITVSENTLIDELILNITKSESITVSENVLRAFSSDLTVSDSISLSENIIATYTFNVVASENISVTDTPNILTVLSILVYGSLTNTSSHDATANTVALGVTNPDDTLVTDGSYGVYTALNQYVTNRFSNISFGIPSDAVVSGITVYFDAKYTGAGINRQITAKISADGGSSWSNTIAKTIPDTTITSVEYGGETNTWGETWSPSDINNNNNLMVQAKCTTFSVTSIELDGMQMMATYQLTGEDISVSESVNIELPGYVTSANVSDSTTISENINASISDSEITVSESITLLDTPYISQTGDYYISVQENITVTESINNELSNLEFICTENISITDNVYLSAEDILAISLENISLSENINIALQSATSRQVNTNDTVSTDENINSVEFNNISINENISVDENITNELIYINVSVSDNLSVSENTNVAFSALPANAFDNINVSENIDIILSDASLLAQENISITENAQVSVLAAGAFSVNISENISINENVDTLNDVYITANESITVSESIQHSSAFLITVSDQIFVIEGQLSENIISNGTFETDLDGWIAGKSTLDLSGSVFYDSTQETSYSDNDDVTTLTDYANSYDATESTNPPKFKTSIQGGQPMVLFDGTNDNLENDSFPAHGDNDFTIYGVQKWLGSYPCGYDTIWNIGNADGQCIFAAMHDGYSAINWGRYGYDFLNTGDTTSDAFMLVGRYTTTSADTFYSYFQGRQSTNPSASVTLNIGSTIDLGMVRGIQFFEGYIGEFGFIPSFISLEDLANFQAHLSLKWGITLIGSYTGANITRDTGTAYTGSASMKISVGSTYDIPVYRLENSGTGQFVLTAYAKSDGSEVTSDDIELYVDGSTQTTTYSSVGDGWYKLTCQVTGSDSDIKYGVIVKADKDINIDAITLDSPGTINVEVIINSGISEEITVSENINAESSGLQANVSDTITLGESYLINAGGTQLNVNEQLTVTESVSAFIENYFASQSENISLSENTLLTVATDDINIDVLENVNITDNVALQIINFISVNESISVSENVSTLDILLLNNSELITIAENVDLYQSININVEDTINVNENIDFTGNITVYVYDNISVQDNVSDIHESSFIQCSELITINESFSGIIAADIFTSENISVTDTPNVSTAHSIVVSDEISISEIVEVITLLNLYLSEQITISENYSGVSSIDLYTNDTITITENVNSFTFQSPSGLQVQHGTKHGKLIVDVDDKNQMWNKEVEITSITSPKFQPLSVISKPIVISQTIGRVSGVKLTE